MEKYSEEWIRQKHTDLELKTQIAKDGDLYSLMDVNKHLNSYSSDLGWAISEASMLEMQLRERDQIKSGWERQAFVRAKFMLKSGPSKVIAAPVLNAQREKAFSKKFGGIEAKPTQKDIENFVYLRWPRQAKYYQSLTQDIEMKLKLLEDYKKLWFRMDDLYKTIGSNIKFERDKMVMIDPSSNSTAQKSTESRLARVHSLMQKED